MGTSAELRFGFWDVTARGDADLKAGENQQPFAQIGDINREEALEPLNVATLEPNFGWPLDGSKMLMPDDRGSEAWGWWSCDLSGKDGAFERSPTLTVSFTQPHSSMGVTLTFLETLPGLINVVWYGLDGAVLADRDFQPDRPTYFCDQQVENYGKIVIRVWSMAEPCRYLRAVHIIFGALEILDATALQTAALCEEVDISALTLPIGTLDASFWSPAGRFSLLNPSGAYRLFQRKQPIEAYGYLDGERQYMGLYYLYEASSTTDSLTELHCENILGVLDRVEYKGGVYRAKRARQLLEEILGLEGVPLELDPALEGETITGWLPICTKREALQQIAFALGAVMGCARAEGIVIRRPPEKVTRKIGLNRKVIGHSVKLEEFVSQVYVTAHSYRLETESTELVKTELNLGRHSLTLSTPAEISAVSGAALVEGGANYAVVEVVQAGEVKIMGKKYVDNITNCGAKLDNLGAGERESIKKVEGATLIDPAKGAAAAKRLLDFYQERYIAEGTVLPGAEQVGECAELASLGGRTLTGHIQRLSIDLTGGYLTKLNMRGR